MKTPRRKTPAPPKTSFSTVVPTVVALGCLTGILTGSFVGLPLLAQQQPPAPQDQGLPEEGDVTLVMEGARGLLRLAFPPVTGGETLSGAMASAARELEEVLRADLDFADLFIVQGPGGFGVLTLTGDRTQDFEQYRSLGNEYLIQANVLREGERFVFEGRLFDLADGTAVVAKRYRGTESVARRIAHTFANEVVRGLTGEEGIFLTAIAFTSDRSGFKELYRMDYDGAGVQAVTTHKSTSMSSAWKPDGSGIAYVSFFSGAPAIYFAALPSGRKNPLVTDGPFNISPTFSPDGRKLAFTRSLDGNSEIFISDANGDDARRMTHTGAIDANAAWSPNGALISFTSSRAGQPHLYLMDAEGANLRRLTFEGDYNDGGAWSPEGDKVVYATRRQGVFQIAVTNVVTLETTVLTSGYGNKEDPQFAPDGRHVVFTSNRSGSRQIYVMDADGTDQRQLTREGNNESPAWSPRPR